MNNLTIKISSYEKSKYFPVKVEWKRSDSMVWSSSVFESEQEAADYIFGRFGNIPYKLIDTRTQPKRKALFKRGMDIPKKIRSKTSYYMRKYNLCSYDAFDIAIRETPSSELPKELVEAWYFSDLSKYLA